tara:strand:- start:1773 stop:3305 length:1533 start_codon:yes stop_codon:yes gene_type:complete
VPEYTGYLAFFRKHYNGDYSLGRSYWVNTFLVVLFAPIVGALLLPWLIENFRAQYGSGAFLFITLLGIAAWLWAIAGTWASANKHTSRGGKQGWATAAKVMIILGVIRTIGEIGNSLPIYEEHMQVALGTQFGPDTKLEVRADGRSIRLKGGINDGSAVKLDQALQIAPAVTTVVLSSTGGWIREGKLLADVIRKRQLNTYVEDNCASACTIAFLAGKERAAAPSATIGFHASRMIGSQSVTATHEETAQLTSIYRNAGLSKTFVDKIAATPNSQMWQPTRSELLNSGVLTRRSFGGETAAFATVVKSKEHLISEFKQVDAFAALAEQFPSDFNRIIEVTWKKLQQGATDADSMTAARGLLTKIAVRLMPRATGETLIAYNTLIKEQLEAVRKKSENACAEMGFPSGRFIDFSGFMPREMHQRELELLALVFRDAGRGRAEVSDPKTKERIILKAMAAMTPAEVRAVVDPKERQRNPGDTCAAAIKLFSGFEAIPLAERGHSLRVVYANN